MEERCRLQPPMCGVIACESTYLRRYITVQWPVEPDAPPRADTVLSPPRGASTHPLENRSCTQVPPT